MSPSLLNVSDLKEILEKLFIEFFDDNKELFFSGFKCWFI